MEGEEELALFAAVAERLRQAHRHVRALDAPVETKAALTRRLLVITEAAKYDLAHADRRLRWFVMAMERGEPPFAARPDSPTSLRHKGDSSVW
ncbi:hypothetical protein [Allostreptomyces psammosilenae]|uniref:Glycosyltransferase A (GT-A) superfamily protein (DUF2064 family) n=1 Tax=Allostreptomyces psammosilenae TaxID=1892865 RepID=A0A853A7R4_9ACTN|nr:hypothetical protein [Allostreptomyces psammosilenae]NYI06578.1 glycosyltransferase A (GT-A) superfamily protein (DUF2064 family) [Allostreptomyces psammosilenae]